MTALTMSLSFPLQGYDLDNENIQLLRLRGFTIGKPLSDEDLQSTGAQDRIAALIGIMEPFVSQQSPPLLVPSRCLVPFSACPRLRLLDLSPRRISDKLWSHPCLSPPSSSSVIQFSGVSLGARIPTDVAHLERGGKGVGDKKKRLFIFFLILLSFSFSFFPG